MQMLHYTHILTSGCSRASATQTDCICEISIPKHSEIHWDVIMIDKVMMELYKWWENRWRCGHWSNMHQFAGYNLNRRAKQTIYIVLGGFLDLWTLWLTCLALSSSSYLLDQRLIIFINTWRFHMECVKLLSNIGVNIIILYKDAN